MRRYACVRLIGMTVAGCSVLTPAWGYELSLLREASQSQFHDIAADLTAAFNDRTLLPAGSGGPWSWGVGGYATTTFLHSSGTWDSVIGHSQDYVATSGIAGYVNLPDAVQVGAAISAISNTDDVLYTVDASYPLIKGDPSQIAVTVRGSVGWVPTVEDFSMFTQSLEVLGSKAYGPWTPYAGLGLAAGEFDGRHEVELDSENIVRPKGYAGVNFTVNLFDIAGEVDQIGHNTSLGLRVNVRF